MIHPPELLVSAENSLVAAAYCVNRKDESNLHGWRVATRFISLPTRCIFMNSQPGKLSISRGDVVKDENTLKEAFFVPKSRYYPINILAEEALEYG
jgi:hypothetical protein